MFHLTFLQAREAEAFKKRPKKVLPVGLSADIADLSLRGAKRGRGVEGGLKIFNPADTMQHVLVTEGQ